MVIQYLGSGSNLCMSIGCTFLRRGPWSILVNKVVYTNQFYRGGVCDCDEDHGAFVVPYDSWRVFNTKSNEFMSPTPLNVYSCITYKKIKLIFQISSYMKLGPICPMSTCKPLHLINKSIYLVVYIEGILCLIYHEKLWPMRPTWSVGFNQLQGFGWLSHMHCTKDKLGVTQGQLVH